MYIPSALLIFGTAIVKKEWLPYAVALAAILSGGKVFSNSELESPFQYLACRPQLFLGIGDVAA